MEVKPPPPSDPGAPVKLYGFLFALALLALFGTVYEYYAISRWEAAGGSHTLNPLLALAYNIGGKTCAVGLMAILVVFFAALGFQDWVTRRKERPASTTPIPFQATHADMEENDKEGN